MPPLVLLAIKELPGIISYVRTLFHQQHPGEPVPTDAEIKAAFDQAHDIAIARIDAWMKAHPDPST